MQAKSGSRFEVNLGDLKLPEDVERRIAIEIQRVVLQEIAKSDFRGDERSKQMMPTSLVLDFSGKGGTMGMYPPPPPPT
jgi:hypothetical protein